MNQIRFRFNEDVSIAESDLKTKGINFPQGFPLKPGGFDYDHESHTATWTFQNPLPLDKMVLTLKDDNIQDVDGNPLDGELGDGVLSAASGDGTAGGTGTLEGTHTYADGGVYTITVTLADGDGGTASRFVSTFVAGAGLRDGTLDVIGSDSGDSAFVRLVGDQLVIYGTFLPGSATGSKSFPLAIIERITADLGDGDDIFTVPNRLKVPVSIRGGLATICWLAVAV